MVIQGQFIATVQDVMSLMAPSAGGSIPDETTDDYAQWLLFIQVKYEEAAKRGFWRKLLKKTTVSLQAGDTQVYMPADFQQANSLYIFYVDGVDVSDPDRVPDDQGIFAEMDTNPFLGDGVTANTNFGRWFITFTTPIVSAQTAPIWYFCIPPKPVAPTDKILLPGDMVAFGALSEVFRTTNLVGSQDDARQEYENRLSTYQAQEMIPPRNEILSFVTNPGKLDRLQVARARYTVRRNRENRLY